MASSTRPLRSMNNSSSILSPTPEAPLSTVKRSKWRKLGLIIKALHRFKLSSLRSRSSVNTQTSSSPSNLSQPSMPNTADRRRDDWETPKMAAFLDDAWNTSKDNLTHYDRIVTVLKNHHHCDVDIVTLQELCDVLYAHPVLFAGSSQLLPDGQSMYLAPDFPGTSLFQVTTTANNKSAWRASFGLIHAENLHEIPDIDDKILCFLRRAVICKEREHAIVTLQGGDAQRTLDIMQNLLDDSDSWAKFVADIEREHSVMLDDSKWKRVRRLMVKLAVSCRYLPPSLYLKDGIQLELVYPVNRGSNAEIYRGIYKGDTVAVKRLWFGAPLGRTEADQLREALYEEALIWRQLKHQYIVTIFGIDCKLFSGSPTNDCIVMPYMEPGNVRQHMDYLEKQRKPAPVNLWLLQIAEALSYLHEKGVVHGDLRGANILISNDGTVRLTDFGLSILLRTRSSSKARDFPDGGTAQWMSPELVLSSNYLADHATDIDIEAPASAGEDAYYMSLIAPPVDIYAFGCVCVELYSRADPQFHGIIQRGRNVSRLIQDAIGNGRRPDRPTAEGREMSEQLWDLVQDCWKQEPLERYTAKKVHSSLKLLDVQIQMM